VIGGNKKYIEMFGSFTEPFNCLQKNIWGLLVQDFCKPHAPPITFAFVKKTKIHNNRWVSDFANDD